MDTLPVELFEYVASYLPPKDFGSLRLMQSNYKDSLENSLKLRVGPSKTIEDPTEEAFMEFVVANSGRYMDRIEVLQIPEDGILEAYHAMREDAGNNEERFTTLSQNYVKSLAHIFSKFPKLRTVIISMINRDEDDDDEIEMPVEEADVITNLGLCLSFLSEAIQGFQINVHLASRYWDIIVFWDGTPLSTSKVRIIGGYDRGSKFQLRRIDEDSSRLLQNDLEDTRTYLCKKPNSVWFYGFSFENFNRHDIEEWDDLWVGDFLVEPRKLLIEKCYLGNMEDYFEQVVVGKTKLAFEDCTIPFSTAQTILDMAANPQITPDLEQFRFQRIHRILFEWEPRRQPEAYDNGESLQQYIEREGLRPAIAHMGRALLTLQRGDGRIQSDLVQESDHDPRKRQAEYKKKNQWFYANYRKG